MMINRCEFFTGYVPEKVTIENEVLSFTPVSDFEEVVSHVKKSYHSANGFCFPVSTHFKYKKETEGEVFVDREVSRSPVFQPETFRFWSTHEFCLKRKSIGDLNNFSQNPSFYFLQVIGYISGYRIMPATFWFDGKVPNRPTHNLIVRNTDKVIEKANLAWENMDENARKSLVGIFYLYNRSASYQWHFEKFSHDFMIFDSALRFYKKHIDHFTLGKNRYSEFLDKVDISYDPKSVQAFADMRNDLFHEIKWGQGTPCFFSDDEVLYKSLELRRMLHAVLGRLIGLEGSYFQNDWKCLGTYLFDVN